MGTIYKRGKIWWISYYENGQQQWESSGSTRKKDAEHLLRLREGRIAEGKDPGVRYEKITLGELAYDFVAEYRLNRKKSMGRARLSVKYLLDFFGQHTRAVNINGSRLNDYVEARQAMPSRKGGNISNGTINRELAALRRMFNLAVKNGKLTKAHSPYVPRLKEDNVRVGYFSHDEFLALREALPMYLKLPVSLGYYTGMRLGEILNLRWDQVNLSEGIIRLTPKDTKNAESRLIPLSWDQKLIRLIEKQKELRDTEDPEGPWVCSRDGQRINGFRKAWTTASEQAKCEGKLFHDLRRTAVRNMVRAGVPERVVMQISGHKTRSVFDRYNIVSEEDMQDAARQVGWYLRPVEQKVVNFQSRR